MTESIPLEADDFDDDTNWGAGIASRLLEPDRPWQVVMDFDRTITKDDTIDALVCQCILYNYEHIINGGGNLLQLEQVMETEQGKAWQECKTQYGKDLAALEEGMQQYVADKRLVFMRGSGESQNHLEVDEQVHSHVRAFQDDVEVHESVRPIEEFSLERVNGTGIFDHVGEDSILTRRAMQSDRHLSPLDIAKEGKYPQYGVSIRKGFPEFVKELERRPHSDWGVVSVNWSSDWIQGILLASLERKSTDEITVISNAPLKAPKVSDIDRRGIAGPSPSLDPYSKEPIPLLTSKDKVRAFDVMVSKFTARSTGNGARSQRIYIGDSMTDLCCLVAADVGIIMCPDFESTLPLATSEDKSPEPALPNGHVPEVVLESPSNPLIDVVRGCGFETKHVKDHEMLYKRVDYSLETSPYVYFLWARNYDEILESGMLSNGWRFDTARKSMESSIHPRNMVGKAPGMRASRPHRFTSSIDSTRAIALVQGRGGRELPTL